MGGAGVDGMFLRTPFSMCHAPSHNWLSCHEGLGFSLLDIPLPWLTHSIALVACGGYGVGGLISGISNDSRADSHKGSLTAPEVTVLVATSAASSKKGWVPFEV